MVTSVEEGFYGVNFEHFRYEREVIGAHSSKCRFAVNRSCDMVALSGEENVKEGESPIVFVFYRKFDVRVF